MRRGCIQWFARRATLRAVAIPLAFLAISLPAQTPHSADACDAVPQAQVPEQDRPTITDALSTGIILPPGSVAERSSIPPTTEGMCDAGSLYYSKTPDRFRKARFCVLTQLGLFRSDVNASDAKRVQSAATGGATEPIEIDDLSGLVLAMVYANGEGVKRDLTLAKRFLCDYSEGIQSKPAAEHLKEFEAMVKEGKPLDVCGGDGGDYGRHTNYDCLGIAIANVSIEVKQREAAISGASSPAERKAFERVKIAWSSFYEAYDRVESTICDGGTGCGPITEDEDLTALKQWLETLKSIQNGVPPASGAKAEQFASLDAQLNQKYRDALNEHGDCCKTDIRSVDRAWLTYRDAWVRFGAMRWPQISADQWRAWQTGEWIDMMPE
jgi:hypothetical protein